MGDIGDYWREHKEYEKTRAHLRKPCAGCIVKEPRRTAKMLYPGQKCTYCGARDPRNRKEK